MATSQPNYGGGRVQTSAAERMESLNSKVGTPMTCSHCGGTFFYKVNAEQYSDGGYGTAQFRSLSMATEAFYVCLCGTVTDIKDTAARGLADRHTQFISCVKKAIAIQKKDSPQFVAEQCASLEELQQVNDRLKWVEDAVASILELPRDKVIDEPEEMEVVLGENISESEVKQVSKPARPGRPRKKDVNAA